MLTTDGGEYEPPQPTSGISAHPFDRLDTVLGALPKGFPEEIAT